MDVSGKNTAPINKAWEKYPSSKLHLLDIHVSTIFARWDGAQAVIRVRTIFSTNISRKGATS